MDNTSLILRDLFSGISRFGGKPAVVFGTETITYQALASRSSELAAYL